jgi:hypothetical protein
MKAIIFILIAGLAAAAGASPQHPAPAAAAGTADSAVQAGLQGDEIESTWGIRVESVRLTASGLMLDFRYRVTSPDKARPLFQKPHDPFAVDIATSTTLPVPKVGNIGQLRSSVKEPQRDQVYFILFSNPGKIVKVGGKVRVVMSDFRADNLTVQ